MAGPRGEAWVDRIDELAAAATDAREVLGELRSELREARRFLREFREATEREVDKAMSDRVDAAVRAGLDEYAATVKRAMSEAVEKVNVEFDKLFNTYMRGRARGHAVDGGDLRDFFKGQG